MELLSFSWQMDHQESCYSITSRGDIWKRHLIAHFLEAWKNASNTFTFEVKKRKQARKCHFFLFTRNDYFTGWSTKFWVGKISVLRIPTYLVGKPCFLRIKRHSRNLLANCQNAFTSLIVNESKVNVNLSERLNLHFIGSAEPMPNHDLSGRTDADVEP